MRRGGRHKPKPLKDMKNACNRHRRRLDNWEKQVNKRIRDKVKVIKNTKQGGMYENDRKVD